jgi:uncharacterized membrane protein
MAEELKKRDGNLKNGDDDDQINLNNKNNKIYVQKKSSFMWRPVPTIISTTLCFLISGILFVAIGVVLLLLSNQIKEYAIRYDKYKECDLSLNTTYSHKCNITLKIEDKLEPPIMVYYQLENFYQNHRRYIKSKSLAQLRGENLTLEEIKADCDPIITVKDLGFPITMGGKKLKDDDIANPCGLIAKSLFNDTYKLFNNDNTRIEINENDITWDSDLNGRYKRNKNYNDTQWTDVENQHFMVWMRPAGLPDFRKLWGRINQTMNPGNYIVEIDNKFPVHSFNGKKSFVITTINILGGKNNFLGIAYLIVGSTCLIMALLFWVGYHNFNSDKNK